MSTKSVLVVDQGAFLETAVMLSRSFAKTYYWTPWVTAFPKSNDCQIGVGIPGLTRVNSIWEVLDEVDLFVFTDVGFGPLQLHLESIGKKVWGSRMGEELEFERERTKKFLAKIGLHVGEWESVKGIDALREFLKSHKEQWVKVDKFRGDFETFFSEDFKQSETRIDEIAQILGVRKNTTRFVVEQNIPDAVEIAFDGYTVDGQFPKHSVCGIEIKDCLDDQTEILTDQGWKLFRDLDRTERFLTLDASDSRHFKIEYQRATEYIDREYVGPMLSIQTQNLDMVVTPNHRLLLSSDQARGGHKRMLVKASEVDLTRRFSMAHPRAGLAGEPENPHRANRAMRVAGETVTKLQYAALMGMYLSEGYTRHRGKIGGYEVNIAQEKHVGPFGDAINALPFGFKRTGVAWTTSHRGLGAYLLSFGKSRDKYVPDEIKFGSQNTIREFLHYYCLGDGSFMGSRQIPTRIYYTISKRMADDVQELLVKVGIPSTVTHGPSKDNYVVYEHGQQRTNRVYPRHTSWEKYLGRVYCVCVPNQIICVRRNGKVCWTGNSGYVGKYIPYGSVPLPLRDINEKLAPALQGYRYRNFFACEARITQDHKAWIIDPCCRSSSPPGDMLLNMYTNLAEVFWEGADGKLVEPKVEGKWCAELLIHFAGDGKAWRAVDFPEKIRDHIKLRAAARLDGRYYMIPQVTGPQMVGAACGIGSTMQEAIEQAKEYAAQVKGYLFASEPHSLDTAAEELKKLEDWGLGI